MKQPVKFNIKGHLKIWGITRDNQRILLVDKKNTILGNAANIVARLLANNPWPLDRVQAFKANTLLATASTIYEPSPPVDQAIFRARFTENSFNDTFDQLTLGSSAGGDFSTITGLSVLKDNTMQIEIQWALTIVII